MQIDISETVIMQMFFYHVYANINTFELMLDKQNFVAEVSGLDSELLIQWVICNR